MSEDQAVIVVLQFSTETIDIDEFVDALEENISGALTTAKVGELDGDELGEDSLSLFVYGRNADRILDVLVPTLTRFRNTGSYVIKRKGPPGSTEERIIL